MREKRRRYFKGSVISRKGLAFLLAGLMVLGSFPGSLLAAQETTASLRIEANGLGEDGKETGITRVLPYTEVDLSSLTKPEPKVIDLVNQALDSQDLSQGQGQEGYYTVFADVYGKEGADWRFMINDQPASLGLDDQPINDQDRVLLYLSESDKSWNPTTDYSFFKIGQRKTDIKEDTPYAQVSLRLYVKEQIGFDSKAIFDLRPATGLKIYTNGKQAWTPDSELAQTDDLNGMVTITLRGKKQAGSYDFDITADIAGASPAHCRIRMDYDGQNAPTLSYQLAAVQDTSLTTVKATFPSLGEKDLTSYLDGRAYKVKDSITSVSLEAQASQNTSTIEMVYGREDGPKESYTQSQSLDLKPGLNNFEILVKNQGDQQVYRLIIERLGEKKGDLSPAVNALLAGLKGIQGDAPHTDWVLAMSAGGQALSPEERKTYLEDVILEVDAFSQDPKANKAASMAKMAIALTSLGVDARQIPSLDGQKTIDLVDLIYSLHADIRDTNPVYGAPYLLSLYDLDNYRQGDGQVDKRSELIQAIVAAKEDWYAWGYDGVGMVLPALSPYYEMKGEVLGIGTELGKEIEKAINDALSLASDDQTPDGGLGQPNSNTVSILLTGLSALGINGHSDSRFISQQTDLSLIDNLLSFRTEDDTLGFTDNKSTNAMSSVQGLAALNVWNNLEKNESRTNLYHFSQDLSQTTTWPEVKKLTKIEVTKLPGKRVYDLGSDAETIDTKGMEVTATYNRDESNRVLIDLSDCQISTIDATSPGTKQVEVSYQGLESNFQVTVSGDPQDPPIEETTVVVKVKKGAELLAQDRALTIEERKTSALDVLKTLLNEADISYTILKSGYVETIDGVGEFSQGKNSGWLYSVNGKTPSTTAAKDYKLKKGDQVLWYFTVDYSKDDSSEAWKPQEEEQEDQENVETITAETEVKEGRLEASVSAKDIEKVVQKAKDKDLKEIIIRPQGQKEGSKMRISLDRKALLDLIDGSNKEDEKDQKTDEEDEEDKEDKGLKLRLKMAEGEILIPNRTLALLLDDASGDDLTLDLDKVDAKEEDKERRDLVGDRPLYRIAIQSGQKKLTDFSGKNLEISLAYSLKEGEKAEEITVYHLGDDGQLEERPSRYDEAKKRVTFTTDHLSFYMIGQKKAYKNPYTDLSTGDWFYEPVSYLSRAGLMTGTAEGVFAPHKTMSRAMLATVLYRLEDSPVTQGKLTYKDTKEGLWYSQALVWASQKGIIQGYSQSRFGPHDPLSRQDLVTMLMRYAQIKEEDTSKEKDLSDYEDAGQISAYALDAFSWAYGQDLIQGTGPKTLSPRAEASRAQVATLLMRYMDR